MKAVIITLALASLASAASLDAQITSTRLPTPSTNRGTTVNGSWQVVGRDADGYTIYERRTTDQNGNIVIQRARRDANGNMTIISSRTVRNNDDRRDCEFNRTTNTVGDIIFGRTGATDCRDDSRRRVDGGWYQVGRGRDNNSIYERRSRDANGNIVIQRARRNPDGTFTIFSTRTVRNDRNDRDDHGIGRGRGHEDDDKEFKKARKEERKSIRRAEKEDREDLKRDRDDDDDDDRGFSRGDDGVFRNSNAVLRGNGSGKDSRRGKHKDKD